MTNRMQLYIDLLDAAQCAPDGKPKNLTGAAPLLPEKPLAKYLTQAFPSAVPFDFTSVADMLDDTLFADPENTYIEDFIAELPPCLPPYEIMFIDTGFPTVDGTELGGLLFSDRKSAMLYVYSMNRHGQIRGPVAATGVQFDDAGAPITLHNDDPTLTRIYARPLEPIIDGATSIANYVLAVTLFGCSLCHCKNVQERHERLPRPRARMRERQNQSPVVWKTLTIEPLAKPKTPAQVAEALDPRNYRRVHLCRGHFAEYGPEFTHPDGSPKGKLFGRIEGRFWIPSVVKGTASSGVVVKNYRVGAKP